MPGCRCFRKNISFDQKVLFKLPGELSSEISVFPDGSVSSDPEAARDYVNKNQIPGKVYDDSEEGLKNSLVLLHVTYIFSVYSDEEGNQFVNLSISKLYSRVPMENGAIQIATTVDQVGSRVVLNAYDKFFRGGSKKKFIFDCSIR